MADANIDTSIRLRRALFWLAWVLLAASLLLPAPRGAFVGDASGISAFYVFGKAVVWSEAVTGSAGSLGFRPAAILALALYSNVVFIVGPYLSRCRATSAVTRAFLLGALAIDACVAPVLPEFARLPAYWLWLASIAALALALVALPGEDGAPGARPRKGRSATADGELPPFVWVLLGFTLFWLAVSAGDRYASPAGGATPADAPLTSYLTDHANVLTSDQAAQLTAALQRFEQATSNQIVVAIYPRAPSGSVEDFTIRVADRSHLGRKGVDNGAMLFAFMAERTARLEVGYGLEGTLTDVDAHRILETQLAPAFARGEYFDGLDTTLGAVFGLVQDAYQRGRMPGRLTTWWRQAKVEMPKMIGNAWPAARDASLAARTGIAFAGTFLVIILWSAAAQCFRLGGDIVRGIGNLIARRPFATGMVAVDVGEVWDTLKLLAWLLFGIVPAAGVVVIAAGGAFGGAGAIVRW